MLDMPIPYFGALQRRFDLTELYLNELLSVTCPLLSSSPLLA